MNRLHDLKTWGLDAVSILIYIRCSNRADHLEASNREMMNIFNAPESYAIPVAQLWFFDIGSLDVVPALKSIELS